MDITTFSIAKKRNKEFLLFFIFLLIFFKELETKHRITGCSGNLLTMSCVNHNIIQILSEEYSYSPLDTQESCFSNKTQCLARDFNAHISVEHCNGKEQCAFRISTSYWIASCGHPASALTVSYQCINNIFVTDMCKDQSYIAPQLHLVTPDFPQIYLPALQCSCTIEGAKIEVTMIQHMMAPDSSVVLILATDQGTISLNSLIVLNQKIAEQVSHIELFVHNTQAQFFKTWILFKGMDMRVKCGKGSNSTKDLGTPTLASHLFQSMMQTTGDVFNSQFETMPTTAWISPSRTESKTTPPYLTLDNSDFPSSASINSLYEIYLQTNSMTSISESVPGYKFHQTTFSPNDLSDQIQSVLGTEEYYTDWDAGSYTSINLAQQSTTEISMSLPARLLNASEINPMYTEGQNQPKEDRTWLIISVSGGGLIAIIVISIIYLWRKLRHQKENLIEMSFYDAYATPAEYNSLDTEFTQQFVSAYILDQKRKTLNYCFDI